MEYVSIHDISQKWQMKASVLELVRTIGTPNVELQQFLIEE